MKRVLFRMCNLICTITYYIKALPGDQIQSQIDLLFDKLKEKGIKEFDAASVRNSIKEEYNKIIQPHVVIDNIELVNPNTIITNAPQTFTMQGGVHYELEQKIKEIREEEQAYTMEYWKFLEKHDEENLPYKTFYELPF